jgi:hypothetical protein
MIKHDLKEMTNHHQHNIKMKYLLILFLPFLIACSNKSQLQTDTVAPKAPKNLIAFLDTIWHTEQTPIRLRDSLMKVHGDESEEFKTQQAIYKKNHTINEKKIRNLLDNHGWPTKEKSGERGNWTICNVIQHADNEVRIKYLPMMQQAVKDKKLEPRFLVRATDRIATEKGELQIYGGQMKFYPATKTFNVWPVFDPLNIDKRRAAIGLGPIAEYLKNRFDFEWNLEEQIKRSEAFEKERLLKEKQKIALEILQKTIKTIDTIETIYYKQDMTRSNPRNSKDTIFRFREMYFKRLITDSIVGVKGHWYMYVNDKENVIYEDIYDGNRLIRKNNKKQAARVYDLVKYPDFKKKHFWSHNTLYGMQYEFKYMQNHLEDYSIEKLNDTIIDNRNCYQLLLTLEDKMTMPGFATKLENNDGLINKTFYFIDKKNYFPIGIHGENYTRATPQQKVFISQRYYDIKLNLPIEEQTQFNTSNESIGAFTKIEVQPK